MLTFDPPDPTHVTCEICDRPFDEQSWPARHTYPDGTSSRGVANDIAACHAECCPICQGVPA